MNQSNKVAALEAQIAKMQAVIDQQNENIATQMEIIENVVSETARLHNIIEQARTVASSRQDGTPAQILTQIKSILSEGE